MSKSTGLLRLLGPILEAAEGDVDSKSICYNISQPNELATVQEQPVYQASPNSKVNIDALATISGKAFDLERALA